MSRKTIQVSEELHKQLKLRSVQEGVPIPDIINRLITGHNGTSEEPLEQEKESILIPDQLMQEVCKECSFGEQVHMWYKIALDIGGIVELGRHGYSFRTLPQVIEVEMNQEEKERAIKIQEAIERAGVKPLQVRIVRQIVNFLQMKQAKIKAKELTNALQAGLANNPVPAQHVKVYTFVDSLRKAMAGNDYDALKAKILEVDPDWKERSPPDEILSQEEKIERLLSAS